MGKYEPVIGLEIHLQLKTKSGMFCGCKNEDNPQPNVNICPVCTGQPGSLPVLNDEAVNLVGKLSLALGATIQPRSVFARKNYFYIDLPKGYQITQYELPFATNGNVEIQTRELHKKIIRIERLHLEEDTAKSTHQVDGTTLVDFNRSGAPLVEIVSRPDMRTAEEAKLYLQQIQAVARAVHASDADLEKGQMRCDVNISIRPEGDDQLYTKIEIKNINSMKSVERAIQFEMNRQSSLWEAGTPPAQLETRGWNDDRGETVLQRVKEQAADYRYFAEPDIPPLTVTTEQIAEWQRQVPELPAARIERFVQEYELSKHDAGVLISDYRIADFYEEVISEMRGWLNSIESADGDEAEVWKANRRKLVRTTFGWITGDLFKMLSDRGWSFEQLHITSENFAEFLVLVVEGKLNRTAAAQVLNTMLDKQDVPNGSDPSMIMQSLGVEQQNDEHTLSLEVDEVILANPEVVEDIKKGKRNKLMFLVGQIMKKTKGTANPETITEMLNDRLKVE